MFQRMIVLRRIIITGVSLCALGVFAGDVPSLPVSEIRTCLTSGGMR